MAMALCHYAKAKGSHTTTLKNTEKITYFCSICLRNGLL